jgi:DNA-binding response OmpR family regulator
MGVDNYICKPINPKLLADQIKTIFAEHFAS